MEELRFSTARRQMRGLRIFLAIVAVAAVALTVADAATGAGLLTRLWAWAVAAWLAALIGLYAYVIYARAFTECTPTGIVTRGLAGRRECPWPQVADIVLRQYQATTTVMVVTRSGARFRLGVPVDGGAMRDPEFAAKVKQIWEYWQSATAAGPARTRDSVQSEAASPDSSASAPAPPASAPQPQPGE